MKGRVLNMKKLISVLLALCLIGLMVPAMAETAAVQEVTAEQVLGGWELVTIGLNGRTMSASAGNMSMTLDLKEDGGCILVLKSQSANQTDNNGKWELIEGGVKIYDATGVSMDCMMTEDGQLRSENEQGVLMVFARPAQ